MDMQTVCSLLDRYLNGTYRHGSAIGLDHGNFQLLLGNDFFKLYHKPLNYDMISHRDKGQLVMSADRDGILTFHYGPEMFMFSPRSTYHVLPLHILKPLGIEYPIAGDGPGFERGAITVDGVYSALYAGLQVDIVKNKFVNRQLIRPKVHDSDKAGEWIDKVGPIINQFKLYKSLNTLPDSSVYPDGPVGFNRLLIMLDDLDEAIKTGVLPYAVAEEVAKLDNICYASPGFYCDAINSILTQWQKPLWSRYGVYPY